LTSSTPSEQLQASAGYPNTMVGSLKIMLGNQNTYSAATSPFPKTAIALKTHVDYFNTHINIGNY